MRPQFLFSCADTFVADTFVVGCLYRLATMLSVTQTDRQTDTTVLCQSPIILCPVQSAKNGKLTPFYCIHLCVCY